MSLKDRRALFPEPAEARFMLLIGQIALVLCRTGITRLTRVSRTRLPVALCSGWQEAASLRIRPKELPIALLGAQQLFPR